jgi:hypothetical protein
MIGVAISVSRRRDEHGATLARSRASFLFPFRSYPMTLAELKPGDRFQVFTADEPWDECRNLAPKSGVVLALSECGATVRFGEATRRRVVIASPITGEVVREFEATDAARPVLISSGTAVVRL